MNVITFSDALHKRLRDPVVYVEQVGNVLFGLFRVFGWWAPVCQPASRQPLSEIT